MERYNIKKQKWRRKKPGIVFARIKSSTKSGSERKTNATKQKRRREKLPKLQRKKETKERNERASTHWMEEINSCNILQRCTMNRIGHQRSMPDTCKRCLRCLNFLYKWKDDRIRTGRKVHERSIQLHQVSAPPNAITAHRTDVGQRVRPGPNQSTLLCDYRTFPFGEKLNEIKVNWISWAQIVQRFVACCHKSSNIELFRPALSDCVRKQATGAEQSKAAVTSVLRQIKMTTHDRRHPSVMSAAVEWFSVSVWKWWAIDQPMANIK